ncbi:hypothetical protein AB205_0148910 [Aquarana catesbeiana]|uniref:Uncharacterized protein n=1 Tax=Aquarana catesbeiana TaxID=8400 RepID=A0A2G9QGV4_AQUCT|nr:hypothetical protein AB205_0148910 [Aquarana catesbeiana]
MKITPLPANLANLEGTHLIITLIKYLAGNTPKTPIRAHLLGPAHSCPSSYMRTPLDLV